MKNNKLLLLILFWAIGLTLQAQEEFDLDNIEPGRFDQGKMWTFENAPLDYFKEAYDFEASPEWLADARKSALRFASWCSASFISEQGLIMTNHHCSRGVTASVMKEGENFDEDGFYASTLEEERQVPDLFVDQLIIVADITEAVKSSDQDPEKALEAIKKEYEEKQEWKGLKLETRTFYSGGKYSLYGFRTYDDIRLVLYPELALGYYGGDPDNFTYPRYNLDFTFFRAYDEDGQPLTPSNYFKFKPAGAKEDELVFIIGNPGSTGRYQTMAQLYYRRDVRAPLIIDYYRNRKEILLKFAETVKDVYKKDSITNLAFGLSNGEKAYTGRLKGFNDPVLMAKKEKKEDQVRGNVTTEGTDPWREVESIAKEMKIQYADAFLLAPSATRGKVNQAIHQLYNYRIAVEEEDEEASGAAKEELETILSGMDINLERIMFATLLDELKEHSQGGYMTEILKGEDPYTFAKNAIEESSLFDEKERAKFYEMKPKKLAKSEEPLLVMANAFVPRYREASAKFSELNSKAKEYEEKIANLSFQLSGLTSPPDATFSLRLADGVVKGYEYNGTTAPVFTTYFGLYDRHYSNNGEYPWNLPKKWMDPPMELLKSPLNFVCTADIIGGNSGSPVINSEREVVGLVFDGNIESLPGFFIFDETSNRTVAVHAGGIAAAVKYIYKADRLYDELNIE
jgi:hypothetical protein